MSRYREAGPLAADAAAGMRIGIVVSRTHPEITDRLSEGALDRLTSLGAAREQIDLLEVPGSFELPMAAATLAAGRRLDAIICIGALIRGETSHFGFLAAAVADGVQRVALDTGIPVTFGVLTCDSLEQARARAGGAHGNKGEEAALAAVELVLQYQRLRGD